MSKHLPVLLVVCFAAGCGTAGASVAARSAWRVGAGVDGNRHRVAAPVPAGGAPGLRAIGTAQLPAALRRTASYAKLDNGLATLAYRLVRQPRAGIASLRASNLLLRLRTAAPLRTPLVLVDAIARGDAGVLAAELQQLGMVHVSTFSNLVSGWLPVTELRRAATVPALRYLHASMMAGRTGSVTSQGDFAQGSDQLRAPSLTPGFDGSGVKVGILSDSFDCQQGYASDVASGDLPAGVEILKEDPGCQSGTDEGRAMAQVVYDVAPGTNLAFYTADGGEADFATGILALAGDGAKVIVDDIGYFDEPVFQDGVIGQAINIAVQQDGVTYFSAAGNNARQSWESAYRDSGVVGAAGAPNAGEKLINFDPTGNTVVTTLPISIMATPSGFLTTIVVQWNQPYASGGGPGSAASFDACLTSADGTQVSFCSGPSAIGDDSVIVAGVVDTNATTGFDDLGLQIGLTAGTAPTVVKVLLADEGGGAHLTDATLATDSGTIQGHPLAAGAAAVGAVPYFQTPACGTDPAVFEPFSSAGGDAIYFNAAGKPLNPPVVRQKPDFSAPDGGATTFFGFPLGATPVGFPPQCQNTATQINFFGTSAAAPHAAGAAALLLQAQPRAKPSDIYYALEQSAIPVAPAAGASVESVPNFDSGYGFIQVQDALNYVTPLVQLSTSAINFGKVRIDTPGKRVVTLTDTGKFRLAITDIRVSGGDFEIGGNCPSAGGTLDPGTSCAINVIFDPRGAGHQTATLDVTTDAGTSPDSVALDGIGQPSGGSFGWIGLGGLGALAALRRRRPSRRKRRPAAGAGRARH